MKVHCSFTGNEEIAEISVYHTYLMKLGVKIIYIAHAVFYTDCHINAERR